MKLAVDCILLCGIETAAVLCYLVLSLLGIIEKDFWSVQVVNYSVSTSVFDVIVRTAKLGLHGGRLTTLADISIVQMHFSVHIVCIL